MTVLKSWGGTGDPAASEGEVDQSDALLTLPEQIAEEIGSGIVAGRYAAGERLVQDDLAEIFKVSRGPVRDALRMLERRGLVEFYPRRGAYVKVPSLDAVADAFSIRTALAALAVRTLAITHQPEDLEHLARMLNALEAEAGKPDADPAAVALLTARLGREVVRRCGNGLLEELMENLGRQIAFTLIWRQPLDFTTPKRRAEHVARVRQILRAIGERDAAEAERLVRQTWEIWRDNTMALLSSSRRENVSPAKLFHSA